MRARSTVIRRGGTEDLDALGDLWLALHRHHQEVGAATGSFVTADDSWARRRQGYLEWLADPDSFLLIGERDGTPVAYALVRVFDAGTEWTDTWKVGPRMAELATLVVDDASRGQRIGSAMLDAVDDELTRLGIEDVLVGVVAGNDRARELYLRRGFRPRWEVLAR